MARNPIRVLVTFPPAMLQRVCDEVPGVELIQVGGPDSPVDAIEAEVLLTPPWDSGNLAQLLDCGVEWVHTIGTGVDRFPFDLLGGRTLTCARGASSIPISEWVLAAMLAYEKRMPEIWVDEAPDDWSETLGLGGLHGRSLGLVGLGGIGVAVAQHALSFGMRVRAHRRSARPSPIAEVELVSDLPKLLEASDHVVLALPLTPDSRNIIDAAALESVSPESPIHLVNVSRGGLVDQDALRPALDDGRVACASLDVADPEPLPAGHWLYPHPKVRLSPHVSWNSPDAFDLLLDTFISNLRRYRAGEALDGVVDLDAGY